MVLLHSALSFIVLSHCINFHIFIFNTFRDVLRTSLLLQKLGRPIIQQLLVIELRLLLCQCIKFHLIPFYTFKDMLRTSFLLHKMSKKNSVYTDDRVMVLAFCNLPYDPLLVYQVSLSYLQYFKRYAPDKSVTSGRTDGRTDRQSGDCMLSLRGA